jgi:cytidylate kinase
MTFHSKKYHAITVSGKIAVGTTTLAKGLRDELGWEYYNTGALQREYDREHNRNENAVGAATRGDDREREMEALTKKILESKQNIIYEAWLSGFVAQGIEGVLKVLVTCSDYSVRVDRVVNRERITVDQAKDWMKQREEENIPTWHRLYGEQDFWDPRNFDVVIDTYQTGPMESLGAVLDKLGYKK